MAKKMPLLGGTMVAVLAVASIALAAGLPPGGTFTDDDGHIFEPAIAARDDNHNSRNYDFSELRSLIPGLLYSASAA